MTWDKTKPTGSELVSLGDDRIRELKQDLENIIEKEHHFIKNENPPKIYHKFSILTTSQEVYTLNGQIWYNSELKQLSYKHNNIIKRFTRNYPINFSILVLAMPTSGQTFWDRVSIPNNYVLGVSNNVRIHNGSRFLFNLQHTHQLSYADDRHYHTINCYMGDATGDTVSVSRGSGSKFFKKETKDHHPDFSFDTPMYIFPHTHTTSPIIFALSHYSCFIIRKK